MSVAKLVHGLMIFIIALFAGSAHATQTITEPFLGVERIHQTETSPRPLQINVSIIDLSAPGISFTVTPRAAGYPGPNINGTPGETKRQTTRQFADEIGAQIAINADYYATTSSDTSWANNIGLTGSNGDIYSPWEGGQEPNFRNASTLRKTIKPLSCSERTACPPALKRIQR